MAELPTTLAEAVKKQAVDYIDQLVELIGQGMGHAAGAERVDRNRELDLWRMPTSPAAQQALRMGGTRADADAANQLWADQMRQEGATDEEIFAACRAHAHELAKSAAKGDPAAMVKYHESMVAKAQRQAMPTMTDEPAPVDGAVVDGSGDDGR